MAGDWIKWTKGLADKREVVAAASALGVDRRIVACCCMILWEWADSNTIDGHAEGVTAAYIDELVRLPGFAGALGSCGWIRPSKNGGISLPNYERHNGETAKKRSLSNDRQAKRRHANVTDLSRNQRDISVTREEKRREESKDKDQETADAAPARPPPSNEPPPEKPKRAQPTGSHAEAIAAFTSRWNAKYAPETYPFNGGKDGAAVRAMLEQLGGDVSKFTRAVERYLADSDPFYAGHGLGMMRTRLERWLVPGGNHAGSRGNPGGDVRPRGRVSAPEGKYAHLSAGSPQAADSPPGADLFGAPGNESQPRGDSPGTAGGDPKAA